MRRACAAASLAVALCATAAGCPRHPAGKTAAGIQFWSLVKIEAGGDSFAMKCLHEAWGHEIRIACFSPVEIPLFSVAIDGNEVVTEASSDAVASRIPFEIGRIGRDVWRVHVADDDGDISDFNALTDPDLPEDSVAVVRDGMGRAVSKKFAAGGRVLAEAHFEYDDGSDRASRIGFESFEPPYTIEIVQ